MPSWNDLLADTQKKGSVHDVVRREALSRLHQVSNRNVIIYYSGWLEKDELWRRHAEAFAVNDADMNGFMACVHGLDRNLGLDLILHTPGGDGAATEAIVNYLRSMFGNDIRAIVPQIAMSAGTMMACAAKSIVMGKHSSIGPIDPQFGGIPAHGIVEEFKRAAADIQQQPETVHLWQPIIAQYHPTLIGEAHNAIQWSEDISREWLRTGMFDGDANAGDLADRVVSELSSHALTLTHARHINAARASGMGLKVEMLESDAGLQDAVLTVHHSSTQTLGFTPAIKLIENHTGVAAIRTAGLQVLAGPQGA